MQENENGILVPVETQDAEKLRGGYYTSPELAGWLCNWAIRSPTDRILEPSCGDGVFLSAAVERLSVIGRYFQPNQELGLKGIEVIPQEAEKARQRLYRQLGENHRESVHAGDFFEWWQQSKDDGFDAVIGNPPFIRFRSISEHCRIRALDIMTQLGLKRNRLTNIWVPFVVAASMSLRLGGRLALVLPAELLQVSYASQLRSFLVSRFSKIDIVTCNELFFSKAEQEVVLILAEGARDISSPDQSCRVTMTEFDTVQDVVKELPHTVLAKTKPKTVNHGSEKWLKYLLTQDEIDLMRELRRTSELTVLGTHASVNVGVVTGRNRFFVLSRERLVELGLLEYTIPIISRSKQLEGAVIGKTEWEELAAAGKQVNLLHLAPFNDLPLKKPLERYIELGEADRVHEGYKCSLRSPWYVVPSVWEPQGFLLRQIYDFPRIVLNDAGATCTDTIHRFSSKVDPSCLIANTYTYLTGASAEIEGRSYGGGMLALEPTEAERLLVPTRLADAVPIDECDALIRSRGLGNLLQDNSKRVLIDSVGLSKRDCRMLKDIWIKLSTRRRQRSRHPAI